MKSRLVKVGNSRGIRLPKALIEEAGLTGEVDIHAEPGLITVRPVESPRKGWAEAAAEQPSEGLLDEPTPTEFETEEWIW
ncbi:MAG TPA: AbrB/MazE/SpoVT family DNA-binding domain-containing protein [Alkalispirochaeta sp.]|nr:AbrB/MazE/SpoVT family DNA-binding domain-containing protein [Alkalispirochaeta sp.]